MCVCEVIDDVVQEKLVLKAWVALISIEEVHNFGGLSYEVGVCFAFPADM